MIRRANTEDSDLAYWLGRWAAWMRWTAGELAQGAPSTASGFQGCTSNYAVSETDSADYWEDHQVPAIVSALDAAIDSLEPTQKRSIWWAYGLTRVEPENAAAAYLDAFGRLRVLVLRRVAIAA